MHSISDIQLDGLATHYVGNSSAGDNLQLSKNLIDLENAELKQIQTPRTGMKSATNSSALDGGLSFSPLTPFKQESEGQHFTCSL